MCRVHHRCSRCKIDLPPERSQHYCRPCANAMARARRKADPEKIRAAENAQRRKRSPERIEHVRQRNRERYAEERLARVAGRPCVICANEIPTDYVASRMTCSEGCRKEQMRGYAEKYKREKLGMAPQGSQLAFDRMSEAQKRWRAERGNPVYPERECRGCGEMYVPKAPQQRYCEGECRKFRDLARKYGVEVSELREMLAKQGAKCALCGEERRGWSTAKKRGDALIVDHCHRTGKVRGFLCGDCNTALGRFNDDPELLRRAADYLER